MLESQPLCRQRRQRQGHEHRLAGLPGRHTLPDGLQGFLICCLPVVGPGDQKHGRARRAGQRLAGKAAHQSHGLRRSPTPQDRVIAQCVALEDQITGDACGGGPKCVARAHLDSQAASQSLGGRTVGRVIRRQQQRPAVAHPGIEGNDLGLCEGRGLGQGTGGRVRNDQHINAVERAGRIKAHRAGHDLIAIGPGQRRKAHIASVDGLNAAVRGVEHDVRPIRGVGRADHDRPVVRVSHLLLGRHGESREQRQDCRHPCQRANAHLNKSRTDRPRPCRRRRTW